MTYAAPKRKRSFGFTWNNYPKEWEELLLDYCEKGSIRFCRGGREIAPSSGTPHIQGHFDLLTARSLSAMQKTIKKHSNGRIKLSCKIHESIKHCDNNRKYCFKDDAEPFEYGEPPKQGERNDLKRLMTGLREEPTIKKMKIMEEFSSVYARYPRFVNEYRLLVKEKTLTILDWVDGSAPNLWISGPPGTGKSRPFQEAGAFLKAPTKWWDGYDGDDDVLIEDLDPSHAKYMGYFLKIWCDRYPFHAQIKGGTVKIRPKRIIVTSNFTMEEVFGDKLYHDPARAMLVSALKRRFTEKILRTRTEENWIGGGPLY